MMNATKEAPELSKEAAAISPLDEVIISHLRKNCRMRLTTLSRTLGIPATTIYSRIQRLAKKGIIVKHASLINFRQLGYKSIYAVIKAKTQRKELMEFLRRHQSVNLLARTNYDSDFIAECIFTNENDAGDFARKLRETFNAEVLVLTVIDEMQKESFLAAEATDTADPTGIAGD